MDSRLIKELLGGFLNCFVILILCHGAGLLVELLSMCGGNDRSHRWRIIPSDLGAAPGPKMLNGSLNILILLQIREDERDEGKTLLDKEVAKV